jgi:hypothetical protein
MTTPFDPIAAGTGTTRFSNLGAAEKTRIYGYGARQGLSRGQTVAAFNRGETIGTTPYERRISRGLLQGKTVRAARRGATPERRLTYEQATPEQREKYAYYLERQSRRQKRLFKIQTTEMMVPVEGLGEQYFPASALSGNDRKRVYAHRRAMLEYLNTGNERSLLRWRGKTFTDWRTGYPYIFMTSLDQIADLAADGVDLTYETLYLNVSSTELAA